MVLDASEKVLGNRRRYSMMLMEKVEVGLS